MRLLSSHSSHGERIGESCKRSVQLIPFDPAVKKKQEDPRRNIRKTSRLYSPSAAITRKRSVSLVLIRNPAECHVDSRLLRRSRQFGGFSLVTRRLGWLQWVSEGTTHRYPVEAVGDLRGEI